MADDAGVLDAGLDLDFGSDAGTTTEPAEPASAAPAGASPEAKPQSDDYKDDKSYREALKAWRDLNKDNPEVLKHVKRAYNLNGQMAELSKLDPKGLNGVRETYALLQSAGGPEKIVEMQQSLASYTANNEMLAAGDPKALAALGPEFDKGLAKLTPNILERIQKSDPEGYANAILPHLMQNLRGSPLVAAFNSMIDDVQLQGATPEKKIEAIMGRLQFLSNWFTKQEERAGQLKQAPAPNAAQDEFTTARAKFEQEKQEHFWNTSINPAVTQFEKTEIDKHLKPFVEKLKLDDAAKADLMRSIRSDVTERFKADKTAFDQFKIYRSQKTPDAQRVISFLNSNAGKYIKEAVTATVNARYGRFLASRPGPKTGSGESRTPAAPAGSKGTKAAPIAVPTKPSPESIDWQATKRNGDMYKFVYVLKNGQTVRWNRG